MSDVARQKHVDLMAEIDRLEESLAAMEQDEATTRDAADDRSVAAIRQEIRRTAEQLTSKRTELARISDGCGRPRSAI